MWNVLFTHGPRWGPTAETMRMAIEGIKRSQELTNQLREALGSAASTDAIGKLFHGIDTSLNNALSGLQHICNSSGGTNYKSNERKKAQEDNHGVKLKSTRRDIEASIVTATPHYDGHQWRKYGEKHINGSKYERSYYRCTYNKELKCPATKTVQQEDGPKVDPAMYSVTYYGRHTCNRRSSDHMPFVIDSTDYFSMKEALPNSAFKF